MSIAQVAILAGTGVFIITVAIQALIWNISKKKRTLKDVLAVLLLTPILCIGGLYAFGISLEEIGYVSLLSYALVGAYIQTYPALKEDIPSVKILNLIANNKSIAVNDVVEYFELKSKLYSSKEDEIINDGLVRVVDNNLKLTALGLAIAKFFKFYRKLLKTNESFG